MRNRVVVVLILAALAACSADRGPAPSGRVAVGTDTTTRREAARPDAAPKPRSAVGALPDRGELLVYERSPSTARGGQVSAGYVALPVQLSEAHAIASIARGELHVIAPDGRLLQLRYERHVEHPDGNWTWIGRLPGDANAEAILTFGELAVFGSLPQGGDRPPLRVTMAGGRTWVVEPGPRMVAVLADGMKRGKRDYVVPPRSSASADAGGVVMAAQAVGEAGEVVTTTVDVLMGYTPGFRDNLGGDSQARTRLNFLIDVGNLALSNSQLGVRWRLVHAMQVNYPDATDNGEALEQLTGFRAPSTQIPPDPAFAALRAARDQYGADLVSLVRRFQRPENNGCGIAWINGGGQSAITQSSQYFGYSVVSDGQEVEGSTSYFCRDETTAHEMGHNMGSQHDVATARGDDGVLDSDEYGRYPYSFGYKTTTTTGNFFTVMAYGDSGQTPNRIFSNPRVTICGATGGRACGVENQADNARSLAQTAPTIASFRATVVPPVGGTADVRNDVDANGRSDLLWSRVTPGQFVTWSMNGSALGATRSYALNTAYRAIGSGDFDGNNYVDVVWMDINTGDVHVWLGQSTGTYTDRLVYRLGTSWTLAGTGDVNGDGKDDLLWSRPSTGQFAWWLMNGGVLAGSRGFAMSSAYTTIGVGDLDGNGRVDVLWRNAAGNIQAWLGLADGSYDSRAVYTLATSWKLVGTGDVNGDGKDDLLWSRPASSQFVHWLMNGAAIAGSASFPISNAFTGVGSGDFDGNGRVDVVWRNSAGDTYVWLGQGSSYSSQFVYRLSGWVLLP